MKKYLIILSLLAGCSTIDTSSVQTKADTSAITYCSKKDTVCFRVNGICHKHAAKITIQGDKVRVIIEKDILVFDKKRVIIQ